MITTVWAALAVVSLVGNVWLLVWHRRWRQTADYWFEQWEKADRKACQVLEKWNESEDKIYERFSQP